MYVFTETLIPLAALVQSPRGYHFVPFDAAKGYRVSLCSTIERAVPINFRPAYVVEKARTLRQANNAVNDYKNGRDIGTKIKITFLPKEPDHV